MYCSVLAWDASGFEREAVIYSIFSGRRRRRIMFAKLMSLLSSHLLPNSLLKAKAAPAGCTLVQAIVARANQFNILMARRMFLFFSWILVVLGEGVVSCGAS